MSPAAGEAVQTSIVEFTHTKPLADRFRDVRAFSQSLCEPLATEDYVMQTMPDVSPTKWHLAHTSWFFEAFLLGEYDPDYRSPDPLYAWLFNSYYVQKGERYYRPERGLLSRPTVRQVYDYRLHVDQAVLALIERADPEILAKIEPIIILGLNHEQQHQELLLTDVKHVLSFNPGKPVYNNRKPDPVLRSPEQRWVDFAGGLHEIGYDGLGFSYDNEGPRHRQFLEAFRLSSRLVTCGEYMEFIEDGAYDRAELWLSEGAAVVEREEWKAPMYWEWRDGDWWVFTLNGYREMNPDEPVCHVSHFEADAYARWAGRRLPTEAEREVASSRIELTGNTVESGAFHPIPAAGDKELLQMYGDVWEWTSSPYSPYPGYRPAPGAVGEYNGKFMCNQTVLRGGSCATSLDHIRNTYRNFFPSHSRWQFAGLRLADDQ